MPAPNTAPGCGSVTGGQWRCAGLCVFRLLPHGFANIQLRTHVAGLVGLPTDKISVGRMTYDLRRLRLHGLIQRIPHSHHHVTDMAGDQRWP